MKGGEPAMLNFYRIQFGPRDGRGWRTLSDMEGPRKLKTQREALDMIETSKGAAGQHNCPGPNICFKCFKWRILPPVDVMQKPFETPQMQSLMKRLRRIST